MNKNACIWGERMENYDVKVLSIKMNNIKNVRHGYIDLDMNKDDILDAQVVGFYGQNGSGKTAVVEAFNILQCLLTGKELPSKSQRLIYEGENSLTLTFEFIIQRDKDSYKMMYTVELEYQDELMVVKSEQVKSKGKAYGKMFVYHRDEDRPIELRRSPGKDVEIVLSGIKLLSQEINGSLLFSKMVSSQSKKIFSDFDLVVYRVIKDQFSKKLVVIKNLQEGIFPSYVFHDFSSSPLDSITFAVKDSLSLSKEHYKYLYRIIERNNVVISAIIPDLNVQLKDMGSTTLSNGEIGVRAEFVSMKGEVALPLYTESAGTLKLFAIMTSLIAAFHDSSACVVVDELDAGVFEYLLGELMEIFQKHSKGQLIFTSHNLRVLEKLLPQNIWFTTTNENNRYIKFKKIQKKSNMRNMYLRTVLVGGQSEYLYEETNPTKIVRSFIEAGIEDGE